MSNYPPGLILRLAERAGRHLFEKGAPQGEVLIRCPWPEAHQNGDAHPSCRLNGEKNVFHCDVCGTGGGVTDLGEALGLDIAELAAASGRAPTGRRRKPLHFTASGPISSALQKRFAESLSKDYPPETWAAFGVLDGRVFPDSCPDRSEEAIAFPLPSGGYHVYRYRRENRKYRWAFSDGGRPDLLVVGLDRPGPVILAEGAWDAMRAYTDGFPVATGTGGAATWKDDWNETFAGHVMAVTYDADDAGQSGSRKAAASLLRSDIKVRLVRLPLVGSPDSKDLSDYRRHYTVDELRALIAEAPALEALSDLERLGFVTESDATESPSQVDTGRRSTVPWPPPPSDVAFSGLAGDIVRVIEPHSEADPRAILVQILVAFGNVIGRSAHFRVEATSHYLNLFTVLVGSTSKGRKGTSWDHVRHRMIGVDEAWAARIQQGLSSGEGVIWAVRDPIYKKKAQADDEREVLDRQGVMTDPGVEDKRLLVVESEFASVLKMAKREGNTLSIIIRQAWDTGELRTLVKNSPAQATGAHISVIGHITKDELRRNLDSTEVANGFANRFLWICARRSKCLPEGGSLRDEDFVFIHRRLEAAVGFARGVDEMQRDDEAREVWKAVYPELSEGQPGLLGAATSRAEAQVMRVSCLYALLDQSATVQRVQLEAALALWEYSEASARFIFGDALGDPVADEILQALRAHPPGLTRTELRDLFKRNRKAHDIDRAMALLEEHGLASVVIYHTGGRPAERWVASRHLHGNTARPVPGGRR